MKSDLWKLYRMMFKSRVFEEKVTELWNRGLIFGEMHTGLGEEAIAAGTVDHLGEGDALALDHRGTPPLIMGGADISALFHEFLGNEEGICKGYGGHMHIFLKQKMTASSGIVGACGPLGAGFALALQVLHPGKIAVVYFGEGALNQGMLLESFNLASAWKLPVLFVCKDNSLAITTPSPSVTAGSIPDRVKGFGIPFLRVDGLDVEAVWKAGSKAVRYIRAGKGPYFIHARCVHLKGHFLGDPLLSLTGDVLRQVKKMAGPLLKAMATRKGVGFLERVRSLARISSLAAFASKQTRTRHDPLALARRRLTADKIRLMKLEEEVRAEVEEKLGSVLALSEKEGRP